jgi:hypothetical protein
MNLQTKLTDNIYSLFDEYNSFTKARGIRRAKAVEWSSHEISKVKDLLVDFDSDEILLHKVGWNTFIGFGLYCGLVSLFETQDKKEFLELTQILKTLLNDIILYTSIGHFISLGVSIEETDKIQFARIDNSGNIYIFPTDTEDLLNRIEDINHES